MTTRLKLPHLAAPRPYLSDGGLETDLLFHHGIDLPDFASFVLLDSDDGRAALRAYFAPYVDLARQYGTGLVLETPTWRANADWGRRLGYGPEALDRVNHDAVAFLAEIRDEADDVPVVISGNVGPRGDGYVPDAAFTARQAEAYHRTQVEAFADTEADLVTAMTLTTVEEAVGFARAVEAVDMASVVGFTVETDGRLPSGVPLGDAVRQTDVATGGAPAYYMVNCAHPSHFLDALDGDWVVRVRAVRANASACSHAELDEAEVLDEGDPAALAADHVRLADRLPRLAVVGGCCGTDVRHVAAIADALLAPALAVPTS